MTPEELREQFIGWQCRIRQYAVRKNEGIQSPGMKPSLEVLGQEVGPVNVQIVKTDSEDLIQEFQFMFHKTQDPKDRYENAIKLFSEYYYQIPTEFNDELTAVYSLNSELADQMISVGEGRLSFNQGNQLYDLNCKIRMIDRDALEHQATYWHNHLFNPSMPGSVKVLGFTPNWEASSFRAGGV